LRAAAPDPASLLWLLQWNVNVQAALVAAAKERGIGAERLRFAPLRRAGPIISWPTPTSS
jgi:predicted O-linked N-acetylglucosamine transferase (SPINDLY family)